MLRKKRNLIAAGFLTAFSALVAHAPNAYADSASCLAKVSSFVAELDELLFKEKSWITPYVKLNERYFPLRDCEVDSLLDMVRKSRFIQSISHNSRANEYFIHFSSDEVMLDFSYLVSEKKSNFSGPMWVHK